MAYGPYYTSELRALKAQQRAITGKEAFSPWEVEGMVRGELTSRYADARTRQEQQRNYELNLARQGLSEQQLAANTAYQQGQLGLEAQRTAMEGTRIGMEQKKNRQAERAAEQAGYGQALQWGSQTWGKGLFDNEVASLGTTVSGPSTATGQASAVGRTMGAAMGTTTWGGTPTGTWGTNAFSKGGQVVGGTLGSILGSQGGLPGSIAGGYGGKLFGGILGNVANTIYGSLTDPGAIFGSTIAGGQIAGGIGAANAAFGYTPGWGETTGYEVDIGATPAWGEAGGYDVDASGGTVICTELHRQGILGDEIYLADSAYGNMLPREVLVGYQVWAIPLTKLMQKFKLLTQVISWFAIPWAKEMAYRMEVRPRGHILGKLINFVGVPLCGFIGTMIGTPKYTAEEVN